MSLKRVRFSEGENQGVSAAANSHVKRARIQEINDDEEPGISKTSKKHTLDSDEEDAADDYEKLDMDKVEGQEEATLEYEGQIKLMPFNMEEDLEEGHFDANGTFIYDKKETAIKDAWLDNIQWDKVKDAAGKNWGKLSDSERETPEKQALDAGTIYSRLLEILQDKETIAGALKKLNIQKGLSAAEERKRRWAAKKAGTNVEEDSRSKSVTELTSLADALVSLGHMEAYQLGPEKIKELLAKTEPISSAKEATINMFEE